MAFGPIKLCKLFAITLISNVICQITYSNELDNTPITSTSALSRLIEQPTITSVYQDSKQLLWVGTQEGLYRFNGSNTRFFSAKQHGTDWLPTSDIRGIVEDQEGNIVIATFGSGLFQYRSSEGLFKPFMSNKLVTEKYITSIYSTPNGSIWIGSPSATYVFNTAQKNWNNFSIIESAIGTIGPPIEIIGDRANRIFIASKHSIWVIDEEEATFKLVFHLDQNSATSNHITSLDYGSQNNLFIGTSTGQLLQLNLGPKGNTRTILEAISANIIPNAISNLIYYKNFLWIGTGNGLYQLNVRDGSLARFTTSDTNLPNNHITDLFLADDLIWIGTYQGLGTLTFSPFITYDHKNSGISNDVLALDEDIEGNLWVGTYDGLFRSYYDESSRRTRFRKVPTIDPRIMTIAIKSSELWVGFRQGGIQIIDISTGDSHQKQISVNPELAVTKILHTKHLGTWIGTYGNGLYKIHDNESDANSLLETLAEPVITLLLELENGDLLIGAEKALYRYITHSSKFEKIGFKKEDMPHSPVILSVDQNTLGDVFVGTKDSGLFELRSIGDGHKFVLEKLRGNSLLEQASIYGIEFDDYKNIWLSTHKGLIKLDQDANYISHFTKSDGLQGDDFNFGAAFKSQRGSIFFGGINGFNQFNPETTNITAQLSDLLLTAIRYSSDGAIVSLDLPSVKTLELTHKNYFVTFEFSVLDFLDPENNQFRYKLENFDPEWIDNGTRNTATYTNLPAGDYVFRVQGANSAGIWNRDGIHLNVRVLPAPWWTWWAYLSYLVGVALFFWTMGKFYNNFAARRRAEQSAREAREGEERAQDEIQEHLELYDELMGLSHKHNLATLDLIKTFIHQQRVHVKEQLAAESVGKCEGIVSTLALLEQCLYFQEEELAVDMHKFSDLLFSELLSECTDNPESIVTINDTTKQRVPAQLASPLSAFISEAVRNSLLHAFEEGSMANYLQISLKTGNDPDNPDAGQTYKLIISDNGRGIPETIQPDKRETAGFAAMFSLADTLGGDLEISSDGGTRVVLTIPVPAKQ